jgi:hypothetical protein
MTTHSHRSVAVITYRIADQANENPDTIMQEFLSGLDKLEDHHMGKRDTIPFDSSKYFDFIVNHSKESIGFLSVYQVKANYFTHNNEVLSGYDPNIHELYVSNDRANNDLPQWTVDFKNNFYIIANPIARLIYFVIGLDFTYQGDRPLESFSTLEFFRFSDGVNSEKYKLQIRNRSNANTDKTDTSAKHNASLSLGTIIQNVVPGLAHFCPSISRKRPRPSLLHIFPKSYSTEAITLLLYKTLRIPIADVTHLENSTDSLIRTSNMIEIAVLNEGASIIDRGFQEANQMNEYFNKYFPSFILALNQREVLLQFNREVSLIEINPKLLNSSYEIDPKLLNSSYEIDPKLLNSSYKYVKNLRKELLELKKRVDIIIFKQIFYSVSHFDELNRLFDELMDKFKIKVLLKDSQECVQEAYSLVESFEREEAKKGEKEKDDREKEVAKRTNENQTKTNNLINLLTLISISTVIFETYAFLHVDEFIFLNSFNKDLLHTLVVVIMVLFLLVMWRRHTK